MSHRRFASGWAAISVAMITIGSLLLFAGGVAATQPEDLHCPGEPGGNEWKVDVSADPTAGSFDVDGTMVWYEISGPDVSFFADEAMTEPLEVTFCVKAATNNSGELTGSGFHVNWLNNGDQTPDISYLVVYGVPTPPEAVLTIAKVAEGAEGPFSFTGMLDDEALEPFELGDGESTMFTELGDYSITEEPMDGWSLTDIDCGEAEVTRVDSTVTVTLAKGDDITCTFTNEMVPVERSAVLTIAKDAGDNTTEEFEFFDDGDISLKGGESFSMEFADEDFDANDQVVVDVWESLSDAQTTAGWELVDIDCDTESFEVAEDGTLTVTLEDQDDVTCTFTNELTPVVGAQLTLEKAVAGTAQNTTEFGFTLGGAAVATTVSEADAPLSLATIAGTYVIGENAMTGWSLSAIDCTGNATAETVNLPARTVSVTVANGESVVCMFTNTPQGGGVLPGNPTPKPTPRGAVLPSTSMRSPASTSR